MNGRTANGEADGASARSDRLLYWAGHGVWAVLAVLSLAWYRERAFFMDAGFQLFNMLNEGVIQIYHHRFVTAVPQLLPYLLFRAGGSLAIIGMAYSLSYILFYWTVYGLVAGRMRKVSLGWQVVFLFTLISLDTFYHIQSEFYLGLTLMVLLVGLLIHRPGDAWAWYHRLWRTVLVVTIAFSHKLTLVFFLFYMLQLVLAGDRRLNGRLAGTTLQFLAAYGIRSVFFTNWYERAKQADFSRSLAQYFPELWEIPANRILWDRCVEHYYMLPLLLIGILFYQARRKEWMQATLVVCFSAGYLLLYNLSDPLSPYRFYAEVSYLPVVLFGGWYLLCDLYGRMEGRWRIRLAGLICFIVAGRLFVIAENRETFVRLHDWIGQVLAAPQAAGSNRIFVASADAPADTLLMEWGVPFTTMHLTALEQPGAARTILVLPSLSRYDTLRARTDQFFSPFKAMPVNTLNNSYYQLGPGVYRQVSREGWDSTQTSR